MKYNVLYIVILACLCPFILSAQEHTSKTQIQSAVYSIFEEGWSHGDTESFDETLADSVLFHYTSNKPQIFTRAQMSQFIIRWRTAFPDLRMEIEELLIQGDLAAARLTLSGTHEGSWAGADPTGKKVRMALMMFFRFEDGELAELWEVDDKSGFHKQLGIIPD